MTKDTQHIEAGVAEFDEIFCDNGMGGLMPKHRDGGQTLAREVKDWLRTYSQNLIEKVREEAYQKGVQDGADAQFRGVAQSPTSKDKSV